jgi:protoporphyrinogen oxidase
MASGADTTYCVIIGGGLTGLSTAYHLRNDYILVEKESTAGGLCRTIHKDGFSFDFSGHLLHLKNDYTKKLVPGLLHDNLAKHQRASYIQYLGHQVPFPFQANLSALPAEVIKECLTGFVHAHCSATPDKIESFRDWILAHLGEGMAKHFFVPYNTKLYGASLETLTPEWCNQFVPKPNLEETIDGALGIQRGRFGYNAEFLYPVQGGIQALPDALAAEVSDIKVRTPILRIHWKNKQVETETGERYAYNHLVSTIPLPELVRRLEPLPGELEEAGTVLRWRTVHCLNIGLRNKPPQTCHWAYFPEPEYVFYRVGFTHNFAPRSVPEGRASLYVEIARDPQQGDAEEEPDAGGCYETAVSHLLKAGILRQESDVLLHLHLPMPFAYVVYDHHRPRALEVIHRFLQENDIHSIGRYGEWKYSSMETAILDGKAVVEKLRAF